MNYHEAHAWLDQRQQFTIKLGLETTRDLLAELGNPQQRLSIIHIAGTNGKGSVGATLLAVLSAAGYRTGFFSSPHLSEVRERFRLNDTFISRDDFARLITKLATVLQGQAFPTYFECATLLALLWFAEQQAEAVILETGMGGRLDATNVVTPLLSIITDISRDHEQYLGATIEAIAGEKAGIIKPGIPVVFSGRLPEALPVIEARCMQTGSPLFMFGRHFSGTRRSDQGFDYHTLSGEVRSGLPLQLHGEHQVVNASLAAAALELLAPTFPHVSQRLVSGLQQVRWPGRMEHIQIDRSGKTLHFLLDGAHNEAGVEALVRTLHRQSPRRLLLLWGNMADKSMGPAYADLVALADKIVLTRIASPRSALPADLFARLPEPVQRKTTCAESVEHGLAMVQQHAAPEDLICVAGSLYLIGRVRQLLMGELVA